MHIQHNIPLKDYSTMRLGGPADSLCHVTSKDELAEAVTWAEQHDKHILVLGGGSNVIFSKGYSGLVIVNRIPGFEVLEQTADHTLVRIGAGENWDETVAKTVAMNLHGIEALSAIPGTSGATPVQNVGAYGTEIADTLTELEAYDLETHTFTTLTKQECGFSYRNSIFKSPLERRYIITSITLRLTPTLPLPPFYTSLQSYFSDHGITKFTPRVIRDAVIAIRAEKLPDPSIIANTGSFFKNPIVPATVVEKILKKHPALPHWPMKDGLVKVAAGWLIDQAGLRGYASHGMRTYEKHALVVVNDSASDYSDLAAFKQEIIARVKESFGITLEQEPELL